MLPQAVYFGKPVVVNTYAVYARDIDPLGFHCIEMSQLVTNEVVEQTREIVRNDAMRAQWPRKISISGSNSSPIRWRGGSSPAGLPASSARASLRAGPMLETFRRLILGVALIVGAAALLLLSGPRLARAIHAVAET